MTFTAPSSNFAFKGRTLLLSLLSICILSTAATVIAINANFTGEWILNNSKSDLGEYGGRFAPKKYKIDGQADAVTIERFTTSQDGAEVISKEKLTFDGKENESTVFGSSKKKSTMKWSDDGQVMTVNSTILLDRNGEITEIKLTEIWKLIDNGQALSVESTSNSSFGTNSMKLLYEKAK
jgi:hypothetical protein